MTLLENFSGLLGKQYLYLQDNGTYYNRYTDEYMSAEDAEHWLYGELSGIINGGEQMKRYNNSSDPEEKKVIKWKLKAGITWGMIEMMTITDEVLEKYFDKVEVEIVD